MLTLLIDAARPDVLAPLIASKHFGAPIVIDTVAQFMHRAQSEPIFPPTPSWAGEVGNSIHCSSEAYPLTRDVMNHNI